MDVPARWPDILSALHDGEPAVLVTDGKKVQAVIMDHAQYRRLMMLAMRKERRQRALALPLRAAESPNVWNAGFEALERISAKFADLSDQDMDVLFGAALDDIRGTKMDERSD